jgi:hypothetical protein
MNVTSVTRTPSPHFKGGESSVTGGGTAVSGWPQKLEAQDPRLAL